MRERIGQELRQRRYRLDYAWRPTDLQHKRSRVQVWRRRIRKTRPHCEVPIQQSDPSSDIGRSNSQPRTGQATGRNSRIRLLKSQRLCPKGQAGPYFNQPTDRATLQSSGFGKDQKAVRRDQEQCRTSLGSGRQGSLVRQRYKADPRLCRGR